MCVRQWLMLRCRKRSQSGAEDAADVRLADVLDRMSAFQVERCFWTLCRRVLVLAVQGLPIILTGGMK